MRKVLFFLFLLCGPVAAELPVVSPFRSFDPIPAGHINTFLESIVANESFFIGALPDRPIVSGQEWNDWNANDVTLLGDVSTVRLRFVDVQQDSNDDKLRAPSFDIEVQFEDAKFIQERMSLFAGSKAFAGSGSESFQVIVRHSRAARQAETKGVRLLATNTQANRFYLNGLDQTGVAIFVPKTPRTGFAGRGVLLCPRYLDVLRVKQGLRRVQPSGYRLSAAGYAVSGKTRGRVVSGLGPGFARAQMQTTENIAANRYPVDESFSSYPSVSVDYTPEAQGKAHPVGASQESYGGIHMELVLHNSFSHKTRSTAEVITAVKAVELQTSLPFLYRDQQFRSDPGTCFAIVKEIRMRQEHTKEALPSMSLEASKEVPEKESQRPGEHLFNDEEDADREENKRSPLEDLL